MYTPANTRYDVSHLFFHISDFFHGNQSHKIKTQLLAMSSSAAAAVVNPFMGITITEKLGKTNHAMWKAQILADVRGARLVGHLTGAAPAPDEEIAGKTSDGKEILIPNTTFEEWFYKDQQALSFVLIGIPRARGSHPSCYSRCRSEVVGCDQGDVYVAEQGREL
jgi:hypothetical protein